MNLLDGRFLFAQHGEGLNLIERLFFADFAHRETDMNQNPIPGFRRIVSQQAGVDVAAYTPATSISARFCSSGNNSTILAGIAKHIRTPSTIVYLFSADYIE